MHVMEKKKRKKIKILKHFKFIRYFYYTFFFYVPVISTSVFFIAVISEQKWEKKIIYMNISL